MDHYLPPCPCTMSRSLCLSCSLSLVEPNTYVKSRSATLQRLGSCTCNNGSVPDRSQVFMQGCAYAARIVRLHAQMQESTCARKAASTHARLHVCTQELHDCMHIRELDLCCHAQSAREPASEQLLLLQSTPNLSSTLTMHSQRHLAIYKP